MIILHNWLNHSVVPINSFIILKFYSQQWCMLKKTHLPNCSNILSHSSRIKCFKCLRFSFLLRIKAKIRPGVPTTICGVIDFNVSSSFWIGNPPKNTPTCKCTKENSVRITPRSRSGAIYYVPLSMAYISKSVRILCLFETQAPECDTWREHRHDFRLAPTVVVSPKRKRLSYPYRTLLDIEYPCRAQLVECIRAGL